MKALLLFLLCALVTSSTVAQLECPANPSEVLILGGGLTGVAAAARLSALGENSFVLLEAQDRLGGRIRNEEVAPGVNVNVGANWIHGVDQTDPTRHPLYALMQECGGLNGFYSDFESIRIYDENGFSVSQSSLRSSDFSTATNSLPGVTDDLARTAYTEAGWMPNGPNDNWVEWFNFDFSTINPPDTVSLQGFSNDATNNDFLARPGNTPSDYLITDNRGTVYLVECLANNFTNNSPMTDSRIHLNTNVTRIEYNDNCVCATATENGQSVRYCGRNGIVTFSLGVLKQEASTLFSPSLPPAKTNAFTNQLNLGFYYIIYATFENRFWEDDREFIGVISSERGYLPVIGVVPESKGVNATMMPVTGEVAFELARLSDTDLRTAITQLYSDIYGNAATSPTNIVSFRWGLNPLFYGSYSNVVPRGIEGLAEMRRPEGRMYFAGEGTSDRYNGFMHGSYLSGIATVNTIMGISSGVKVTGNTLLVTFVVICKILYF